jgi:hypothetical protein
MTPISPDQYETVCFTCGACVGKPWVSLTNDEVEEYSKWFGGKNVVRAIEQRLKERNT